MANTSEMLKLTDALVEERAARLAMEQHLADIHDALKHHKHDTLNVLSGLKMSLYLIQRDVCHATPERLDGMYEQLNKLTALLETALQEGNKADD
ncbi:MAG: hypothetical protein AAFR81_13605 [Chloroflexota bacterium]